MTDSPEEDACSIATDAAMSVALDECTEGGLMANLSRMVGLDEKPDPSDVPDELTAPDCMEMDMVRAWIVVRSKNLIDDGVGMTDAIEQAWDEAGGHCGW